MNTSSSALRSSAGLAGLGLIATPLVALATPAFAADSCLTVDSTATEVLPGVCELQYVETGDFSFTPTSGIAKLSAVIVGAGGARDSSSGNYGGGGGAVVYVANVDVASPTTITVGLGAMSGVDAQGGSSSVNSDVADGGYSGSIATARGGNSGNGFLGGYDGYAEGGGAGAGGDGAANDGGIGVTASAVANDADMWPALSGELVYGGGGSVSPTIAGYGEAGWGGDGSGSRDYGMDGLVILRWSMKQDLPATGFNAGNFAMFAAAFMIPGAALLAFSARGRRARSAR